MSLERKTATSACNIIQQLIKPEFPSLTLEFILYREGKCQDALEKKRLEITSHPAGALCWEALTQYGNNEDTATPPKFTGISLAKEQNLLSFLFPKKQCAAFFFLCLDDFSTVTDLKIEALSLVWHALNLFIDHQRDPNNTKENPFITPSKNPLKRASHNMLADSFAAFTLEILGEKKAFYQLTQDRCFKAISANIDFRAEFYPFPMALDAVQIISAELGNQSTHMRPITHAFNMTKEILFTVDEQALEQWISFTISAQQMAWLGIPHKNILGAAVYHSENVYIRSTGYIIAETLNLDPSLPMNYNGYDPFTEQDFNAKRHQKSQKTLLKKIIEIINDPNSDKAEKTINLTQKAMENNEHLLSGDPIGWSAYALIRTIETLEGYDQQSSQSLEELIISIFKKNAQEIKWLSIVELNKLIMIERRKGQPITGTSIIKRITHTQIPQADIIAHAFTIHEDAIIRQEDRTLSPTQHVDKIHSLGEQSLDEQIFKKDQEIEKLKAKEEIIETSTIQLADTHKEAPSSIHKGNGNEDSYMHTIDTALSLDDNSNKKKN